MAKKKVKAKKEKVTFGKTKETAREKNDWSTYRLSI